MLTSIRRPAQARHQGARPDSRLRIHRARPGERERAQIHRLPGQERLKARGQGHPQVRRWPDKGEPRHRAGRRPLPPRRRMDIPSSCPATATSPGHPGPPGQGSARRGHQLRAEHLVDLIAVADEFMDIMKVASISRKKAREAPGGRGVGARDARQGVTPEFGFREASPSVAAAALAAIKGGTPGSRSSHAAVRGGSSRARRAAPPRRLRSLEGERATTTYLPPLPSRLTPRRRRPSEPPPSRGPWPWAWQGVTRRAPRLPVVDRWARRSAGRSSTTWAQLDGGRRRIGSTRSRRPMRQRSPSSA